LSQLAKVDAECFEEPLSAEKWKSLLHWLRNGVQRGLLACPVSQFQIQEVLLASNLLDRITRVQLELSDRHYFREWEDILVHQTAIELLRYLEKPENIDPTWTPFVSGLLSFVLPQETIHAKMSAWRFCEELRDARQEIPDRTYAEQYKAERTGFLQESFLQPLRQILGLDTYHKSPDPIKDLLDTGLFGKLLREARIPIEKLSAEEFARLLCFFESDLVDRVPFIQIGCPIHASLMVHEKRRSPKVGDFIDIPSIASTLPYCEIITTDVNMRQHIVNRLHLDEKYQVGVFSATDESLDSLISLITNVLKQG
jgi:hypothetical protein